MSPKLRIKESEIRKKPKKKRWGCFWLVLLLCVCAIGVLNGIFEAEWGDGVRGRTITDLHLRHDNNFSTHFFGGIIIGLWLFGQLAFWVGVVWVINKFRAK